MYRGHSVAAVGTNRVLVGAPEYGTNSGAVLVFNTNGTLLTTITNPTPAVEDFFGARIAMLGNDRVVIGVRGDNTGVGSAYVFNVNGTLLHTLTNPAQAFGGGFGLPLAAFGSERSCLHFPPLHIAPQLTRVRCCRTIRSRSALTPFPLEAAGVTDDPPDQAVVIRVCRGTQPFLQPHVKLMLVRLAGIPHSAFRILNLRDRDAEASESGGGNQQ